MIDSKNDTNGQELHILKLQLGDSTAMVKAASVDEQQNLQELESRHFANPADRAFPINTKEATERSIVYFYGNSLNGAYDSPYPQDMVEDRLKKAARFWSVTDKFYNVKRAYVDASREKAAPVKTYTYAMSNNRLPIDTPEQVIKSASALIEQRERVAFTTKSDAALKILKAATKMDISDSELEPVVGELQKIAGLNPHSREAIRDGLVERGEFYKRAGVDDEVYKMAATTVTSCSDSDLDHLCGLIDAFEHVEKAAKVKASPIEDVFFADVPADDTVRLSSGTTIDHDAIKAAGLIPFYALGESVPTKVTDKSGKISLKKAAAFLETLSSEDCDTYTEAVEKCLN